MGCDEQYDRAYRHEAPVKKTIVRNIKQIAPYGDNLAALCDDGTLWFTIGSNSLSEWKRFPSIPQDKI